MDVDTLFEKPKNPSEYSAVKISKLLLSSFYGTLNQLKVSKNIKESMEILDILFASLTAIPQKSKSVV